MQDRCANPKRNLRMNKPVNVAALEKSVDLFPAEQIKSPENARNFAPARKLPGIDPRLAFLARAAVRLDLVEWISTKRSTVLSVAFPADAAARSSAGNAIIRRAFKKESGNDQ
jgi:hypothetical protein